MESGFPRDLNLFTSHQQSTLMTTEEKVILWSGVGCLNVLVE